MKKYVFRPYDPRSPMLFEAEKIKIKKILREGDLIEHIGSTAVPGLGGKGIIDICIATERKNLKILSQNLQKLGYEFGPKGGSKERLFHKISRKQFGKIRIYHVHVTFPESLEWANVIILTDYLRDHPDEALRYSNIKKMAVEKANEDREVYMMIKRPIIEEMIKRSL